MSRDEQRYAVRFGNRARLDTDEARVRLAEVTDLDHALDWYNGFLDVLATLASNPNRHPIAYENRFFQDTVYAFLYRLTPRSVGYRVFFTIVGATDDAPFVHLIHVRHGTRKPVTRAEARRIEEDND